MQVDPIKLIHENPLIM